MDRHPSHRLLDASSPPRLMYRAGRLPAVAAFCRERGIVKLGFFGSVLSEDFDPRTSDVDVLVEFDPAVRTGFRFFGYSDELAEILGCKVDLNTAAMLSRQFRDEVLREALPLYE